MKGGVHSLSKYLDGNPSSKFSHSFLNGIGGGLRFLEKQNEILHGVFTIVFL